MKNNFYNILLWVVVVDTTIIFNELLLFKTVYNIYELILDVHGQYEISTVIITTHNC